MGTWAPVGVGTRIRRSFSGHVVFRSDLNPKLHDYRTPEFTARFSAGEKRDLAYELTIHQGYNRKQDNVTLENKG